MLRIVSLLSIVVCLTVPARAAIVYDSEGFEAFNLGALVGQDAGSPPREWRDFNPSNGNRFRVSEPAIFGNRVVAATGSSEIPAFVAPAINQLPLPGEIWVVEVDIARTIAAVPVTPSSNGFNVDIYPSNQAVAVPNRIAGFGLGVNAQNNAIVPFVSVFDGSTGGMVLPVDLSVAQNEFVSFRAELNFDTETFRVFVNGIDTGLSSFVNPSSSYAGNVTLDFGDADLQHDPVLNATDVGYFDNYRIFTVPEPSSLLGGFVLLFGCAMRRRR